MNAARKLRNVGIVAGVAAFVAAGLVAILAAEKPTADSVSEAAAIPPSVVSPAEQLGAAFAAVAARAKPAVVSVYSEKMVKLQPFEFPFGDEFFERFFDSPNAQPRSRNPTKQSRVPQRGMGSGMILDREGHILTNFHVVSDVDEIKVQLADKRSFPAKVIGTDPKTDVAVIQITGDIPQNLATITLGDSDALEQGNLVIAIGAPFGLAQTVTHGIISAKGRSDVGIAAYEDLLQTDAPINPGNSGGPLVNMRGEVIGMNSAIATGGGGQSAGVGFAIPSNMIKTMLPTLIKGQPITRGMLGVVIQDLTEGLAKQFHRHETSGALVSQVNNNSPAEKAGLKSGDIIVRYDGTEVHNSRDLRNLVAATAPGKSVKLDIFRDGSERTLSVTIAKMAADSGSPAQLSGNAADQLAKLGLSVHTLTPDLEERFNLQREHGVVITDVKEGSAASMANLEPGDLIVELNREPVANADDFKQALSKARDQVLLLVKRNGATIFVVMPLN